MEELTQAVIKEKLLSNIKKYIQKEMSIQERWDTGFQELQNIRGQQ